MTPAPLRVPTRSVLVLLLGLTACADVSEGNLPAPESRPGEPATAFREPTRAPGDGFPLSLLDDSEREWTFEEAPSRIVSLVPSATAALRALGAGDRLVGRTDFDRDPDLRHLPSVGGGLEPSLERLIRLEPDLVVRFEGESDLTTPRGLDRAGIPHFAVRPDTIGDVHRIISSLSRLLGAPERGDSLLAAMQGELEAVRAAVGRAPRPRVVVLLGGDPPWVAAGATFLHELLEIAGGENVFADAGPLYAPVSVEEVLRREPDLLLVVERARIPAGLREIPVRLAPPGIQRPGPEMGSSAREIARLLHPDRLR